MSPPATGQLSRNWRCMAGQIFTSGAVYSLNGEFGTVMEFYPSSGLVQASGFDGGRCQQWEFIPANEGFIVRCVGGAKDGSAAYLHFEGGLCGGEKLRASSRPMVWHIARDGDMIRLLFSSKFCADLDVHGKSRVLATFREHIQLVSVKSGVKCQLWYPSRCNLESFLQGRIVSPEAHHPPGENATANDAQPHSGGRGASPGPGALVLVNVKCYPRADTMHEQPTQLWTFIPSGAGFAMQSGTVTGDGQPLYLTIEGPAVAAAAIVVKPYPVSWDVRRYETDATGRVGYRVYWPGTNLLVTLAKQQGSKGGMLVDGQRVQLAQGDDGEHEVWRAVLP
ncbi:hypothetical protein VTO73DRAFT_10314 [Trametes versicolor]